MWLVFILLLKNKEVKAIILAASWGTRLRPMTKTTTKALVKRLKKRPLFEYHKSGFSKRTWNSMTLSSLLVV